MTLNLLLDEVTQGRILLEKLRRAGHAVKTVSELNLNGRADAIVFAAAQEHRCALMTENCADFVELASQHEGIHFGLILIYKEHDRTRNMSSDDIIRALENLETTEIELKNQIISLNYYRYSAQS